MRLVLDTSVMVAALRSDAGASRALLLLCFEKQLNIIATVSLFIEYEAVLTRSVHLEAAGVTSAEVGVLLDAVASLAEPTEINFQWRPFLRDPDDDMVLKAAVNGRADAIVTFNLRDFVGIEQFGIRAITPREVLHAYRSANGSTNP